MAAFIRMRKMISILGMAAALAFPLTSGVPSTHAQVPINPTEFCQGQGVEPSVVGSFVSTSGEGWGYVNGGHGPSPSYYFRDWDNAREIAVPAGMRYQNVVFNTQTISYGIEYINAGHSISSSEGTLYCNNGRQPALTPSLFAARVASWCTCVVDNILDGALNEAFYNGPPATFVIPTYVNTSLNGDRGGRILFPIGFQVDGEFVASGDHFVIYTNVTMARFRMDYGERAVYIR